MPFVVLDAKGKPVRILSVLVTNIQEAQKIADGPVMYCPMDDEDKCTAACLSFIEAIEPEDVFTDLTYRDND